MGRIPTATSLRLARIVLYTGRVGYYPDPNPKKVNGCLETLVLTKVAFQVLAPPLALLFGSILGLVLIFYAFGTSVWLGLLALGFIGGGIVAFAVWERKRVQRQAELIEDPTRDVS